MSGSNTTNVVTNTRYSKSYVVDLYSNYSLDSVPLQITDTDAISNMIYNVVTTSPGERPFQPAFGSGIPQMLFNNISVRNAQDMLQDIFTSVDNFIPFVTINTQVSKVYADLINGLYFFELFFTVQGLPGTVSTTLTLAANQ